MHDTSGTPYGWYSLVVFWGVAFTALKSAERFTFKDLFTQGFKKKSRLQAEEKIGVGGRSQLFIVCSWPYLRLENLQRICLSWYWSCLETCQPWGDNSWFLTINLNGGKNTKIQSLFVIASKGFLHRTYNNIEWAIASFRNFKNNQFLFDIWWSELVYVYCAAFQSVLSVLFFVLSYSKYFYLMFFLLN